MHLGLKIKLARVAKGFTQNDLAVKINKTRPLISHIEQTGKVNYYTLRSICDVLEMDTDDMGEAPHEFEEPLESLSSGLKNELMMLKSENRMLKEEIQILRELVNSQKMLIQMLNKSNA